MNSVDLREKKKIWLSISLERILQYYPEVFLMRAAKQSRIVKSVILIRRIDTSDLNIEKGRIVIAL